MLTLLVARVGLLQTLDRSSYAAWGEANRRNTVTLTADRGTVYDRNRLELALSAPQKTIWADPRLVLAAKDPEAIVQELAKALGFDAAATDRLRASLSRDGAEFAYVARQVDDATEATIMAMKLPGVASYSEPKRFTPGGDLAVATVGRTDTDGVGISGVEKLYDEVLTGKPGSMVREVDIKGRTIPIGAHHLVPAEPGRSVQLTIDSTLTYTVERMLVNHVRAIGAKGGMVTVLDRTGDVLAMASVATNATTGQLELTYDRPLLDAFEPGSVMKIVPAAGALDSGASALDTSWHLDSLVQSGDDEIANSHASPVRDLSLRQIVVESDNVGAVRLAQSLGPDRFENYLHTFGFGEKTAIGFPDESVGILPPSSKWYGSQKDTIAYGQGVSVSQMQLAAAVNAIANKGVYVATRLLEATIDPSGTSHPAPIAATHRAITEQAAADMTNAMQGVVCDHDGTVGIRREKYLNLPGYTVAGKTGTAYKAQNKNVIDGYDPKTGRKKINNYKDENRQYHYMASFVGFLPVEDPRLTIAVTIDEPPVGEFRFGASGAAPLFAQIAAEAMRLMSVPPSPGGQSCPDAGTP